MKNRDSTIEKQSPLAESPSTLSLLAEILELRKWIIIWVSKKGRGYKRHLVHFIIQLFLYDKISFLLKYQPDIRNLEV